MYSRKQQGILTHLVNYLLGEPGKKIIARPSHYSTNVPSAWLISANKKVISAVLSIRFGVDIPSEKVGGSLLFKCQRRKLPTGVWGHAPQKILKFRYLEMLFLTFSRQYLGLKNKCYINHIPCLLQPFFSSKSQSLAFRKSEMINLQMLNQKVHSMF